MVKSHEEKLQDLLDIGYEICKRAGVGDAYLRLHQAETDSKEYWAAWEEIHLASQIDYQAIGRKTAEGAHQQ